MVDESTDMSLKEKLSVCARWLEDNKAVQHFLGIVYAKDVTAKGIASDLTTYLKQMRGLGFDGASTMSGHRTGVQSHLLHQHSPSAIYVHCWCHQLQLAALNAASEHIQVKRVLGTLLFSKEEAEKLPAELNSPEIKMQKPSDTCWLCFVRSVGSRIVTLGRFLLGGAIWVDLPCKNLTQQSLVNHTKSTNHQLAVRMATDLRSSKRDGA